MNKKMTNTLAQGDSTPVILKGTQEFMNKQIPVIVGGFGEDQKVVLAKTIAEIHGMKTKHVNELINRNIKRFKSEIDILDLGVVLNDTELKELGFTQQALNSYKGLRAKGKGGNIYLLSERGYAKLIKIMDTDLAWEIHDRLIDEYFQLREAVKQQVRKLTPLEELRLQYQVLEVHSKEIESVREEVTGVREEFQDLKDNMPLFGEESDKLQAEIRKVGVAILGGYKSNAYNDNSLRGKVYKDIQNQLKREFGVERYKAIKRCQLDIAMEIVQNYKAPTVLVTEISKLNNQMSLY